MEGLPLIQPDWEWTAGQGMVLGVLKPVSLLTHKSQERPKTMFPKQYQDFIKEKGYEN